MASRSFSRRIGGLVEAPPGEHVGEGGEVVGHAVEARDPAAGSRGRRCGARRRWPAGPAPARTFSSVVLPAPLRPTRPTLSRARTVNDTPSSRIVPPASMRRFRAWSTGPGWHAATRTSSRNSVRPVTEPLAPLPPQPAGVPWPTSEWEEAKPDVADAGSRSTRWSTSCSWTRPPSALGHTHALLVVHHGRLVVERYGRRFVSEFEELAGIEPDEIDRRDAAHLVVDGQEHAARRRRHPRRSTAG